MGEKEVNENVSDCRRFLEENNSMDREAWPATVFPGGSDSKDFTCNGGDLCLIPGWGRSLGEGNSYLLQYSCLENSMDGGSWQVTIHGVTNSCTGLSDFDFQVMLHGVTKESDTAEWLDRNNRQQDAVRENQGADGKAILTWLVRKVSLGKWHLSELWRLNRRWPISREERGKAVPGHGPTISRGPCGRGCGMFEEPRGRWCGCSLRNKWSVVIDCLRFEKLRSVWGLSNLSHAQGIGFFVNDMGSHWVLDEEGDWVFWLLCGEWIAGRQEETGRLINTLKIIDNNDSELPFRVDSVNGEKGKDLGCIIKTEWTQLINKLNVGMKKKEMSRMIPRFLD